MDWGGEGDFMGNRSRSLTQALVYLSLSALIQFGSQHKAHSGLQGIVPQLRLLYNSTFRHSEEGISDLSESGKAAKYWEGDEM